MLSFKEYTTTLHTPQLPCIQGDILDDEQLALREAIDAGHYDNFIGPMEKLPESLGFKKKYGTIYTHPEHPGAAFHFSGSDTPKRFDSFDDAMEYDQKLKDFRWDAVNAVHQKLVGVYHPSKYNTKDKDAISKYTDPGSNINAKLLRNAPLSEGHVEMMRYLDSAVEKTGTPDELVVYSGTNEDHADILRSSDKVHHPGYISTSIDIKKAVGFAREKAGDLMKIHLPHNHSGLYAGDLSQIPSERELILPRGMTLRVDRSKQQVIVHDLNKGRHILVHHMYPV